MRVGLFIDTFNLGGAETMVIDTASLLKSHGHEPVLLHFGSSYIQEFADANRIENHTIPNHSLYKKTYKLPIFILRTISFIRNLKLDCLHSHLYSPIITMHFVSSLCGLRHVGTLHDIYMVEETPRRIHMLSIVAFLGTRFVAVSNNMLQFYRERGRFPTNSITYIPNFVNESVPSCSREITRQSLELKDEIVVISVGRLVNLKRFDLLIKAAEIVNTTSNITFYIAGDGPLRSELELQISNSKLKGKVILLGERTDVINLLNAADIFVLASDTEGMSRSILEAMASALPIIATDVGGNSDLVEPTKNGLLIPPNSSSALATALNEIMDDSALRIKMGEASRNKVNRSFGKESFLNSYLKQYSK
ncbi:glycosyltransferase family 4 protein [Teredinibacter haidensis]|uniref:glycosyltransferase family 4 protein n=1 Tax=Teredinibacter haidensis TaxID=2731755 RepID=UPI0009489AC3|nr:glycosyltransferase family 4 protein [Teredinibacter haidensis]